MKDIKNWLDADYPENQRRKITDLYLNRNDFEGELNLTYEEFPKLERVWIHHELNLITNFKLKIDALLGIKTPKGLFLETERRVEVIKYTPIKERLAELYPNKEINKDITELDLTQKGLKGSLDLSDFGNLEELTVNADCPWDRKNINSNFITGINFADNDKITKLTLTNLPETEEWDLGKLNGLTNLEELNISGSKDYPTNWTGSLKDLGGLNNLDELDISYCPNLKKELEKLDLSKIECKGTDYERRLKPFGGDFIAWCIVVFPKEFSTTETEVAEKIKKIADESRKSLKELNKKQLTDLELESKIELLLNA